MTRHQTGLMVLRVWTEEGSTVPLRVDVRRTHDLSSGWDDAWTLTDAEKVLEAVRTFLHAGHTPAPPAEARAKPTSWGAKQTVAWPRRAPW